MKLLNIQVDPRLCGGPVLLSRVEQHLWEWVRPLLVHVAAVSYIYAKPFNISTIQHGTYHLEKKLERKEKEKDTAYSGIFIYG